MFGLQLTQEWDPAERSSEQPAKVLLLEWLAMPMEATNTKTMDSVAWLFRLGQKPNSLNADRNGEGTTLGNGERILVLQISPRLSLQLPLSGDASE